VNFSVLAASNEAKGQTSPTDTIQKMAAGSYQVRIPSKFEI
jgi:hypothetical protein